ncbi:MAG: DUF805 domain-containing protein [Pedobacter sp.]|nr:DUF805 domain-containing protein [Pedobacter sp.]
MNNPYASPSSVISALATDDGEYQPRLFSFSGRIGRLRYLAYSIGIPMLILFPVAFIAGMLSAALGQSQEQSARLIGIGIIAAYIPVIIFYGATIKRRLNDMNQSGWIGLLMLIPLINIVFWLYLVFKAGTDGSNDYGQPATKNSTGVILTSLTLPLIALIGILAAISIPAYQDYVKRAKAAQAQQVVPQETWQQSQ